MNRGRHGYSHLRGMPSMIVGFPSRCPLVLKSIEYSVSQQARNRAETSSPELPSSCIDDGDTIGHVSPLLAWKREPWSTKKCVMTRSRMPLGCRYTQGKALACPAAFPTYNCPSWCPLASTLTVPRNLINVCLELWHGRRIWASTRRCFRTACYRWCNRASSRAARRRGSRGSSFRHFLSALG